MTLTIELSDTQAAALKAQAEAQGLTLESWIRELAERYTPPESIAHLQDTAPKEWSRLFLLWARGHDRTKPLLSDEAVQRESIYSDRF